MSISGKIAISLGVASSALLAAWLFSGDRKGKTKEFVAKKAAGLKDILKSERFVFDDQTAYYV